MATQECPLCHRLYSQLSQHLTITHMVKNGKERKMLLAISSGRVDVRKVTCPVPACGKSCSRMDHHLKGHTEMTVAVRRETLQALKCKKILQDLAELRASNLTLPLSSSLDLVESGDLEEDNIPLEAEEEWACDNPSCLKVRDHVADLNRQVDILSRALRDVTRRYRLLRRSRPTPSSQVARVTSRLLSALCNPEPEGELEMEEGDHLAGPSGEPGDQAPSDQPPAPQPPEQREEPFPDHVAVLSEYRAPSLLPLALRPLFRP